MSDQFLTAEELLGGAAITQEIIIPPEILKREDGSNDSGYNKIVIRPLTLKDIQELSRATKEDKTLVSSFMIHRALVNPRLSLAQAMSLHGGLAEFLVESINIISGLKTDRDMISDLVQSPLVKVCFIMAKEFGWTPMEVSEMTMGQVLLYLETLNQNGNDKS